MVSSGWLVHPGKVIVPDWGDALEDQEPRLVVPCILDVVGEDDEPEAILCCFGAGDRCG